MGNRSRVLGRLVGIFCLVALTVSSLGSADATGVAKTAIPYLDTGYRYSVVPNGGGDANFADPTYDDSGWATGAAGFGTLYSGCALTSAAYIGTVWPINTDILVRKHFTLPAGANNLKVSVFIDNNVQVYVNGTNVSGGTFEHDGCAEDQSPQFSVPDSVLNTGDNVIALRGIDLGVADYLDLQVTYDAPTYQICTLYDATKAHNAGSTVPIKLRLCDENGNNVSSPDIVVHATGVQMVNGSTAGTLDDSGAANSPELDFRYDATLDGYIFNLSTKSLAPGTWEVTFTVDGEAQTTYSAQFVVR